MRQAAGAVACVAVVACVWLTSRQVEIWSNEMTLWEASARAVPLDAAVQPV